MPVYGLARTPSRVLPAARPRAGHRLHRSHPLRARAPRRPRRRERRALRFVSVGAAVDEHEVRIVDDAGREVADRTVGRLAFRGPS
jgi:hypothetical protein